MRVEVEYRAGEWIIKCNGKPIARVYLDLEIYERLGGDPYDVDAHVYVEAIKR